MRTNKELQEVLLNNDFYLQSGLCSFLNNLWSKELLSFNEYEHLQEIIQTNRPKYKWYHRIYNPDKIYSVEHLYGCFYWEKGFKKPRIEFIKKYLK